jgi:hypothetical protein
MIDAVKAFLHKGSNAQIRRGKLPLTDGFIAVIINQVVDYHLPGSLVATGVATLQT